MGGEEFFDRINKIYRIWEGNFDRRDVKDMMEGEESFCPGESFILF